MYLWVFLGIEFTTKMRMKMNLGIKRAKSSKEERKGLPKSYRIMEWTLSMINSPIECFWRSRKCWKTTRLSLRGRKEDHDL